MQLAFLFDETKEAVHLLELLAEKRDERPTPARRHRINIPRFLRTGQPGGH